MLRNAGSKKRNEKQSRKDWLHVLTVKRRTFHYLMGVNACAVGNGGKDLKWPLKARSGEERSGSTRMEGDLLLQTKINDISSS